MELYDLLPLPTVTGKDRKEVVEDDFAFSIFQKASRMTRLNLNTKKPILYLVHTDSIMGPTVGIADDTSPNVGGVSNPDVD
jgi:hypothetical protein